MTSHKSSLNEIHFSEGFLKEFEPFLEKPSLTIKDLYDIVGHLSNKNIHDWQRKGLTFGKRENEDSGWLRFSLNDIVRLKIIVECRSQGISLEKIKEALDKISSAHILTNVFCKETHTKRQISLPLLSYGMLASMRRMEMLLVVDEDKAVIAEKDSINQSFIIKEVKHPMTILILPLFAYVKKAVSVIQNDKMLQALKKN